MESSSDRILDESARTIVHKLDPEKESPQSRGADLQLLMHCSTWDARAIKRLAWCGVDERHRADIWSFLLGHHPADRSVLSRTLQHDRWLYHQICEEIWDQEATECTIPPLAEFREKYMKIHRLLESNKGVSFPKKVSLTPEALEENFSRLVAMYQQIDLDVCRTCPGMPFIRTNWAEKAMRQMLSCWTWMCPSSGYSQGMSDLLVPFLVVHTVHALNSSDDFPVNIETVDSFVNRSTGAIDSLIFALSDEAQFLVEADTFWCFYRFLHVIEPFFASDHTPIHAEMTEMERIIRTVDFPLSAHLTARGVRFPDFAYRWFRCLLVRELPLVVCLRLWDTYLSEGDRLLSFHTFVCAALLCSFSKELQQMETSEEILLFLKALPKDEMGLEWVERLIAQSFINRHMFQQIW